MKNQSFRKLFFLCLLSISFANKLEAQDRRWEIGDKKWEAATPVIASEVTAAQYCDFLNHAAVNDPYHLYNEAVGTDPLAACIARVGAPGRWHYEVIAGRENYPIQYVSDLAQLTYANRLQVSSSATSTSTSNVNSYIEDVSSNNNSFEVEVPSRILTLLAVSSPASTSTSNFNSYIEDVSGAVGFAALLALCPELMVTGDAVEVSSEHLLPLEDFHHAVLAHSQEARLVISEQGAIVPYESDLDVPGRNRAKNIEIIKALKTALQHSSPEIEKSEIEEIVHSVLGLALIKHGSLLTVAKLQEVLSKHTEVVQKKASIRITAAVNQDHLLSLTSLEASLRDHMESAITAGQIIKEDWDRVRPLMRSVQQKGAMAATVFKDFNVATNAAAKARPMRIRVMSVLKDYEEAIHKFASDARQQGLDHPANLKRVIESATTFITSQIIESLDFGTPKDQAVFWTGYDKRNKDVAMIYAGSKNKFTIEMTRGGRLLDGLSFYAPDSPIATDGRSKLGDELFDAASERFAQGATGNVTAIIYDEINPRSAYHRIERPILKQQHDLQNIVLTEEVAKPNITVPLVEKIDAVESENKALNKTLKELLEQSSSCLDSIELNSGDTLSLLKKMTLTRDEIVLTEESSSAAKRADLKARAAKSKAHEMNFDKESAAYKAAEEAWNEANIAYGDLLKALEKTPQAIQEHQEIRTTLQDSLKRTKVNESIWRAHQPWVEARKTETRLNLKNKERGINETDAEEAASDWSEAVDAYENVLQQIKKAHLKETAIRAVLHDATNRRDAWTAKIAELQKIQHRKPIDPEEQERIRLKQEERRKRREEATRKAVQSEEYRPTYHQWPLPDLLPGKAHDESTYGLESKEETDEEILPPPISEKELEKIGKELFKKEHQARQRRAKAAVAAQAAGEISKPIGPMEENKDFLTLTSPETVNEVLTASERIDQARLEIERLSLEPTQENEARWMARKEADRLFAEAGKIAATQQENRGFLPEDFHAPEVEEEGTVYGQFPKNLSVIGSTVFGAKTAFSRVDLSAPYNIANKSYYSQNADLEKANNEASAADVAWEALVQKVEKQRLAQGGRPIDFSEAIIFWEDADKKAFLAKEKREKARQKEIIAMGHKEAWEANTIRWRARMMADQNEREAVEAERQAQDLYKEEALIKAKEGPRSAKAKKIIAERTEASSRAAKAKADAIAAEDQWLSLAMNHHNLSEIRDEGKAAALEKLKLSDQAVVDLWYKVTNHHADDELQEGEDPKTREVRHHQEAASYKEELLEQRKALLVDCFSTIKTQLAIAKKAYGRVTARDEKEAIKRDHYDLIAKQEEEAQKKYAQQIQEVALKAAREAAPGAEAAWEAAAVESKQMREDSEKTAATKAPSADLWADENKFLVERAKIIEVADEKAFSVCKKEKQRLVDIEMIWEEIIEAKKRKERAKREAAVQAHRVCDEGAWSKLTEEERYQYHQDILQENEAIRREAITAIAEAAEAAKLARSNLRKAFLNGEKLDLLEKAAEKTEARLGRLQMELLQRERAIEIGIWSKRSPEERKAELEKRAANAKAQAQVEAASTSNEPNERIVWQKALDCWQHAIEAESHEEYESFLFWKKAAEFMELSAQYDHEAIEASEALFMETDSKTLWSAAAQQSQALAEDYAQIASGLVSENSSETEWSEEIDEASEASETLFMETDSKALWSAAARQSQDLAGDYAQVASVLGSEKGWSEETEKRLNLIDQCSHQYEANLKQSAEYLKKATAANSTEASEQASLWRKATEQLQHITGEQRQHYHEVATSSVDAFHQNQESLLMLANTDFLNKAANCFVRATEIKTEKFQEASEVAILFTQAGESYKAAAEQRLTTIFMLSTYYSNKRRFSLERAGDYFEQSARYLLKVIEVMEENEVVDMTESHEEKSSASQEKISSWREVARYVQISAKYWSESAKAWEEGDVEKASSLYEAAFSAYHVSNQLAKAIEARTAEKIEEAAQWEKAARESQRCIDFIIKAIDARAVGKADDAESWSNAASGVYWASNRLAKAIEAQAAGNPEEAAQWEKAARESQRCIDFTIKAIDARAVGKDDDAASWSNAASGVYWASNHLAKAIEAQAAGNPEEAAQWEKAAREDQKQSKYFIKAIETRAAGKADDAENWTNAGNAANLASDRLAKAIDARAAGKPEEATQWEEAAREQQKKSEYYLKAIDARAAGNSTDAESWQNAARGANWAANRLAQAIEARTAGKLEEATQWEEAARESQKQSEYYLKAIDARAAGKADDAESWNNAANGADWLSSRLVEVIQAEVANKPEEAAAWRKAADQSRLQAENYAKAATVRHQGEGYKKEAESWDNAGLSATWASHRLETVIHEEAAGNTELTLRYNELAQHYKTAGEYFAQAAMDYSEENQESDYLNGAGEMVFHEAQQLNQNVIEELSHHYANFALERSDHEKEASCWQKAARAAELTVQRLSKASERRASGNWQSSLAYVKVASYYQAASDFYVQAAQAYAKGKEGASLENNGQHNFDLAQGRYDREAIVKGIMRRLII